jgi:Uma2 family endonuclease
MSARVEATVRDREPPSEKLSYEQFLDWCDEDTMAEWVDGEVRMVSPASLHHADLAAFLVSVLRPWVEAHELGVVYTAPFQMRLPEPLRRGREPDILFVRREHLGRFRHTYLDGPADLVVEITSPGTMAQDRGDKFVEYEQAGIPEYWLLDRDRTQAEFYQLGSDGRYHLALGGAGGVYASQVLAGLRFRVDWLWEDPLPRVLDVLREIGILS